MQPGFLPPHGNYRELLSYQKAEVVYDLTFRFCQRFLNRGDRTVDQMVQAARSGKQNIVERKQGLRHVEGNGDQADQRRQGEPGRTAGRLPGLPPRARFAPVAKRFTGSVVRARIGKQVPVTYDAFRTYVESRPAEVVANIALCLIHQTNFLLDQQIRRLEQDFIKEGGVRERMTRARRDYRKGSQGDKRKP